MSKSMQGVQDEERIDLTKEESRTDAELGCVYVMLEYAFVMSGGLPK